MRGDATACILALVTTLLPGCEYPDAATDSPVTLRDSAGVTIAETPGGIWDTDPRWTVSSEPALRIGAVEGDDPYLFSGVRGAVELDDGRVVVANGGSNSLRWYDAQGRFLFERGGAGEGPGEFGFLAALTRAPGDTLVATDIRQRRITVFTPDGDLVETVEVEGLLAPPGAAHRLTDASFVLGSGGFSSTQIDDWEPGLRRTPEPLVRLGGGLPGPDTVGTFPGPEMYFRATESGGWAFGSHPFGRTFYYGTHEDLVFVAPGEGFRIDAYSAAGDLARSIRAPDVDLTLTPERIEDYKERVREGAAGDPEAERAIEESLEDMVFPETRPPYRRLLVSGDGLWLEEHRAGPARSEARWAVFDHGGGFRGIAVLPAGFSPREARDDRVLGSWRDELDVEYVVVYELLPATNSGS